MAAIMDGYQSVDTFLDLTTQMFSSNLISMVRNDLRQRSSNI